MLQSKVSLGWKEKARAYFDLTKFRLSSTVVFSGAFGFILGSTVLSISHLLVFSVAAFLTTAAANTVNQIIEKELDILMKRTADRPLHSERLSIN